MIVKTIKNIYSPAGCIISGVSLRAQREGEGYKVNNGEFKGQYIPAASAIILSNIVLNDEGRIPRGQRYA